MSHPAFELLRTATIDSLNLTIEEYTHKATGAQHIHLSSDSSENVFLVALRTVPHDSKGVAHILEHTALCGSEKYPVRDPFFMMIRRSLNTFMNAFTSSDWTAYPFASENKKDFNNLLDVYLDAVFFSRLDPLDFAQEGHRVEFEEPNNPESKLVYKGVVFNEMKGAMSSVSSQLWHTLCKYLYPTTTYHHNSGGEPAAIPDLSYEELQDFYQSHYHPSNAIFMTFGDIPAADHQAKFQAQALSKFERRKEVISVPDEKRYPAPVVCEEFFPADNSQVDSKSHVVVGWLLGKTTNLQETLRAQLLNSLLFDNSASPLQKALETTDLGSAPSPLCGMDDSHKEVVFVCGLEGVDKNNAEAIEQLILDTLKEVAENGVGAEVLEASLHQLELHQREIGGDSYPYGLQLILNGLAAATHRGDVLALLDLEPALAELRKDAEAPDFVQRLVQGILDNTHRVRLTLKPEASMADAMAQIEANTLAEKQAQLSDADKADIVQLAEDLKARQEQQDDESVLPKVGIADVPPQLHYTPVTHKLETPLALSQYAAGTNGLVYQQAICKLPALTDEELDALPHYSNLLTELGLAEGDYLQSQHRQAQVVGAINAYVQIRGSAQSEQDIDAYLTLSAKALARNHKAMTELMRDTLYTVRFDELSRLKDMIAQARARREQSVTGNGHGLAMSAACSQLSPAASISHRLSGLAGIQAVKTLDDAFSDASNGEAALTSFAKTLAAIHQKVIAAPLQFLQVAEADKLGDFANVLTQVWGGAPEAGAEHFQLPSTRESVQQGWLCNTQVNFCAKAYPTVALDHPDAAALTVLGGFLRNGFLHRSIREQGGAYGGGASQDNNIAAFRFFSYRDPRLGETLADFEASITWLLETDHTEESLEQAILGVIGSLDKPGSPAGEAKQTFHAELFERTQEIRQRFRERVLAVSLEDLKRVVETYLTADKASTAVIAPLDKESELENLGLDIFKL